MSDLITGGCQCGAVRFTLSRPPERHALCHCRDCQRASGAPAVAWIACAIDSVAVTGTPVVHASSADARRHFCGTCGTGLFYTNDMWLPGIIDIQSVTCDDAAALVPSVQVQTAERLPWMAHLDAIPAHLRFRAEGAGDDD